jgi:hypothetical protein
MRRDWFALVAGPLAWFCAHVGSWMLAPGAHEAGRVAGLYVIDGAALAISIIAGVFALGRVRVLFRGPPGDRHVQRARFLAASGLALSALSILLLLGLTLPLLLLSPGAEP